MVEDTMTVSVLIPTRDRLEYLRHAVESVRRQSRADWEVVIADNASSEDIGAYVASLDDPRILYRRSDESIPVTDNWNVAIDASTGEQVIMLGDDDALMPGYLEALAAASDAPAGAPDVYYTGAYLFAYPGVFPEHPGGYVQHYGYADFLQGGSGPRVLEHHAALALVRDAMRFRLRFGFNMQFATLSRRLIDGLRAYGPVFQSPFPDYYAMCAALLEADRIVADPRPLVAIGVTPKSYGYYHANRREDEGMAFLEPGMRHAVPPRLRSEVMPGSHVNTGWLLAMDTLETRFGARHGLAVDVRRYRFLQALTVYRERHLTGAADAEELRSLRRHLRGRERLLFAGVGAVMQAIQAIPAGVRSRVTAVLGRRVGQLPEWEPPKAEGRYADVLELFDALRDAPPPELAARG
jgi:glycosyltransferase involved in cell wall biosynthesis